MNYAKNLPLMPRHLPGKWRSMSLYEISPKSVLSESEQRLQKEKKMKMFYQLREARACYQPRSNTEYIITIARHAFMTYKHRSDIVRRPGFLPKKQSLVKV